MIPGIRYICTTTGYERFSQNVSYRTDLKYELSYDDYDIIGFINTKTYAVVKCVCDESHDILVDTKIEKVKI